MHGYCYCSDYYSRRYFSIIGAVRNRDRFMDNYKARRYVRIFGRNGARVSYVIRGVFLIIVGITFVILFRF